MKPLKPIIFLAAIFTIALGCSKSTPPQTDTVIPAANNIPWNYLTGTRTYIGTYVYGINTTHQQFTFADTADINISKLTDTSILVTYDTALHYPITMWIDTTDALPGCVTFADWKTYIGHGPVHTIIYYTHNDSIVYLNHWYWPGGFYDYVLSARSSH